MRHAILIGSLALLLLAAPAALAQENPCNPCSKKAENPCAEKAGNPCNPCGKAAKNPCAKGAGPTLNPCEAKHGLRFMVNDPVKRNTVTFSSTAPLEDFTGTTNDIVGALTFDPTKPERGVRGRLRVSVRSMDTGIPLRNEHMRSSQWLDAAKYPHIDFAIKSTGNVRLVKKGDGFRTYAMTIRGGLTLHGVTRAMQVEARITHLTASEKTRSRLPGDLLAGRVKFSVRLANFGIRGMKGVVGSKVGETIDISVSIVGNTGASAKAGNPGNPCNPCAKSGR